MLFVRPSSKPINRHCLALRQLRPVTYCSDPLLAFLPSLASFLFGERMSRPTGKLRGCLLPRLLLSSEIILI